MLDDLDEELFVSLGGGDGAFCLEPPSGGTLPAAEGQTFSSQHGYVCLWGFSPGRAINVQLYDPSGQFVADQEFTVDDQRDGVGVVQILLWFAGLPTGDWTIVVEWVGPGLQDQFRVSEADFPVISVAPTALDPFGGERWLHWWTQNSYTLGDNVAIFGAGFPPDSSLPLGIYYQETADPTVPAQLGYRQEVRTDSQGRFEVYQPVEALALQGYGTYYAIVPLDPSYQPHPAAFDPLGAVAGFLVTP